MRNTRRGAALGLAGGFTALAMAGPGEKPAPRQCLSILYPWSADARFDFDYYTRKHLVMMRELYGDSVGRIEVRKGLRQGDGSPPAYVATATIEIRSMEAFEAAGKQHLGTLFADIPNFSDITPVGQIEEIVGT
jgi:uncharacterized protein (TIGR02118 family)